MMYLTCYSLITTREEPFFMSPFRPGSIFIVSDLETMGARVYISIHAEMRVEGK